MLTLFSPVLLSEGVSFAICAFEKLISERFKTVEPIEKNISEII